VNRVDTTLPVSSFNSYTWASRHLLALMPIKWHEDTSRKELKDIIASLDNILSTSPLNSYTYFLMAEAQKTIGNEESAAKNYKKAIRLNPVQANYLQNYGLFLADHDKKSMADSFMRAGIRHGISNPDYKRNYAKFLIGGNEKEKALQIMEATFAQQPDKAASDIAFLVGAGFSDDDIRGILPQKVVPHLAFANYLAEKGDLGQAAALYRQALTHIDNTEEIARPYYFYRVSRFFREQKRYEEALEIILQAIKLFPNDAELRVRSGNLYMNMGLTYRAVEEYQQALAIDQGNSQAKKNLAKLKKSLN